MADTGEQGGELQWYALRVPPEQRLMELTVRILRRAGVIADIATEQRLRRKTKRDKERTVQMFTTAPGYVFAAAPVDQPFPWRAAFRWHLVRSVVSVNGRPARLDDGKVRAFLKYQGEQLPGYLRYLKTGAEFNPGDHVFITTGPLADFTETAPMRVEDIRDGEAFFIMRLLGKDQEVRIPVDQCVKAA